MRTVEELLPAFREAFNAEPQCAAMAPGRVNLIGEHTDYNEGFVLPVAVDLGVTMLGRRRDDTRLRIVSLDMDDRRELDLAQPIERSADRQWSNYVAGAVAGVAALGGKELPGMDLLFAGDVPVGGGLSSSAAVEIATATAVCALAGITLDALTLALLCQKAEHAYAGVQCGIMDQFISTHGQRGHALLLDCRDLSYSMIPIAMPRVSMLVIHSGVSHGLANSAYNERRAQCEAGVAFLRERIPRSITSLRDLTIDDLLQFHEKMDPTVVMRCRHVITENDRVHAFAQALAQGAAARCGRLLLAGHMSLRQDYEVSCDQLNALVDTAMETDGVYGARMVGAGFGGCVLVLVNEDQLARAQDDITTRYRERTQHEPRAFRVHSCDGGRVVML